MLTTEVTAVVRIDDPVCSRRTTGVNSSLLQRIFFVRASTREVESLIVVVLVRVIALRIDLLKLC